MTKDSPNLRLQGVRLRRWRRAAGVKRGELATRLGYSSRTVKAWETGTRRMTAGTVPHLVEALQDLRIERAAGIAYVYDLMDGWNDEPEDAA